MLRHLDSGRSPFGASGFPRRKGPLSTPFIGCHCLLPPPFATAQAADLPPPIHVYGHTLVFAASVSSARRRHLLVCLQVPVVWPRIPCLGRPSGLGLTKIPSRHLIPSCAAWRRGASEVLGHAGVTLLFQCMQEGIAMFKRTFRTGLNTSGYCIFSVIDIST